MAGNHETARSLYGEALKSSTDTTIIINNIALSYLMEGKYNTSIQMLSDIAFDDGVNQIIRQNLALAYGLAGDWQAAKRTSSLHLDPVTIAANLRYYDLLRQMNDTVAFRRLLLGTKGQETSLFEGSK
ncbi:MAG: hypothetical protein V7701_17925 [Sneathiella sp.]